MVLAAPSPGDGGGGMESLTPNTLLVLDLPSARSSPLQRVQKRFALGRGVNVLETVTLPYKQQEEQDASGRAGLTNGDLRKPLLNKGRQPLLDNGEGAPGAGPTRKPGNQGMYSLPRSCQQQLEMCCFEGWACVGSRVAMSQEVGTNSSGNLGLTGPSDRKSW